MRSRALCLLGAIVVVSTFACSSAPAAPTDPVQATLAPGGSVSVGSLTLTFVRVTADSRCPGDVMCVQAGDAQLAIETTLVGSRESAELSIAEAKKRVLTRSVYTITLIALTPYPFVSQGPIAPGAYRATFEITSGK